MKIKTILHDLYLEYLNNYLTIERMAEHKELEISALKVMLEEGKKIHDEVCEHHKYLINQEGIKKIIGGTNA